MFAQDFDAASFVKGFDRNLENAHEIRMAVRQAKKYVLDYNASRQLCDLALPKHWFDKMTELRRMARSPHQKIWVEFNNKARRERLLEILKDERERFEKLKKEHSKEYIPAYVDELNMAGVEEVIPRLAWLIETHEKQPSAHRASLIMGTTLAGVVRSFFSDKEEKSIRPVQVMPFAWQWDTEDNTSSEWGHTYMMSMNSDAMKRGDYSDIEPRFNIPEMATGLLGYDDKSISLTKGYGTPTKAGKFYKDLSSEFSGELRYIMAFVASLSVTKIVETSINRRESSKHASGRTMPAYEFTEVKITIPRKRRLADYIARHGHTGIKMREHDVERFWRTYQHGSGPFCEGVHTWELGAVPDKQYCARCPAWRTWVKEHKRGDKELGRIEHVRRVVT